MMDYEAMKEICKQKAKDGKYNRGQRIVLEQTIFQDLMRDYGCCFKCGRKENLTLDHIIPRDILLMLGIDVEREIVEGNYDLLCRPCNNFKANRLDFSIPMTRILLLRLLENI